MEPARKITIEVPPDLLDKAQEANGAGITQTSTWIAYLQGDPGPDADLLDPALSDRQVLMPPVVLAELLSSPRLPQEGFEALPLTADSALAPYGASVKVV